MPAQRIFTKSGKTTAVTDDASAAWLLASGWTEGVSTEYEIPRTPAVRLDDHDVRIADLEDAVENIQGVNVLQDPEFDSWTTPTQPGGWGTFWGTGSRNYFRETTAPYSGQNALGVNIDNGLAWVGSAEFAVQAGDQVAARVFARANTDTLSRMGFALFVAPSSGNPDHFGTGATNLGGPTGLLSTEWTEYTASWTVPAGNTKGRLYFSVDSPTPAAIHTAYLDRAKAVVTSGEDDTGWITPTFNSPWIPYDSTDWGKNVGYRRINGIVYGRGLVKPSSGAPGPPASVFTLPAGFRPIGNLIRGTYASDLPAQIRVLPSGDVRIETGTVSSWITLGDMVFPADA